MKLLSTTLVGISLVLASSFTYAADYQLDKNKAETHQKMECVIEKPVGNNVRMYFQDMTIPLKRSYQSHASECPCTPSKKITCYDKLPDNW